MMKRISFFVFLLASTVMQLQAQSGAFESAFDAVRNMHVGWNLGNSLECHQIGVTDVATSETLKGQPVTKVDLMEMMKIAGFNVIRVPVTWYPHLTDASGTIQTAWLDRVEEVVNYVLDQGMYCIINVHHDTGKDDNKPETNKGWLRAQMENYNTNKDVFENIWRQVANRFKNYNEKLIFESFNEMVDINNCSRYANNGYAQGTEEMADDAYSAINAYNSSFVQTVRSTGGNNANRNLIIKTYDASDTRLEGGRNPLPFQKLTKPENSNHIIVGVHSYPTIVLDNAPRDMSAVQAQVDRIVSNYNAYLKNRLNVPLIITEWGTSNVDAGSGLTDYDKFKDHMFEFVDYYVQKMKQNNIATVYWMGLSGQDARKVPKFHQADLAAQILKAFHGEDYQPMLMSDDDHPTKGYNATFKKQWAEHDIAKNGTSDLKETYVGVEVILDEQPSISGDLSFRAYKDANTKANYHNINSIYNYLDFSQVSQTPLIKVSLVWRSEGTANIKIKYVRLVKKDGTKEIYKVSTGSDDKKQIIGSYRYKNFITAKLNEPNYATLYYGYENFIVPPYMTASTYKVENGQLVTVKTYNAGDIIPEKTGVILNSTIGTIYKLGISQDPGVAAEGSMMRGSDVPEMTTGGSVYYKLSLNAALDANSIGFYYGAAGGGAFLNGAHKAYLAVPEGPALAPRFLFGDSTTGIEAIDSHTDKRKQTDNYWYTLDGRRLNQKPTAKGVYVFNGRKWVVK